MSTTRILTIVFFLTSVGLAYYLYDSINSSIEETKRIQRAEKAIINKLKMIREAQLAYNAVNGQYTSDWDKLLSFVDTGSFYLIERTETVITLDYGADSTYVELDTLGTVPVMDSVFSAERFPKFDLQSLPYVPFVEPRTKFEMFADKITKSGVEVDVVEVWNPKPINPEREEDAELNSKKPLRFGSRTAVTTAGNWE